MIELVSEEVKKQLLQKEISLAPEHRKCQGILLVMVML